MAELAVVTSDVLKSLMRGGMKSAMIRDASDRPEVLYEAPINSDIGEPCLRTKYKYQDGAGGTSRKVIAWEEEIVPWPGYEIISAGAGDDIDLLP